FPKGTKEATLRIDLHHAYNWDRPMETEIKVLNNSTLIGKRYSSGWANKQQVYFTLRRSDPFQKVRINGEQDQSAILEKREEGQRDFIGSNAQLVFADTEDIEIKVALSMTNNEKSTLALQEIDHWDFEETRTRASQLWDSELNKIEIATQDKNLKTVFYSALYH